MIDDEDPTDDEAEAPQLQQLAEAIRTPSLPKAAPELSRGWAIAYLLMRAWAGLLFAAGMLILVFGSISVYLSGEPFWEVQTTPSSWRVHGWGLAVVLGGICLILSAAQSRMERKLRRKKGHWVAKN